LNHTRIQAGFKHGRVPGSTLPHCFTRNL